MSTPSGGGNEPYGEPNRTEYRLEGFDVPGGGHPDATQNPGAPGYDQTQPGGYPDQGYQGQQGQQGYPDQGYPTQGYQDPASAPPGYGPPQSAPPGYGPASAPPGYGQPGFGDPGYAPPPPPKKSNMGLIIGLVGGVVAILLCVGLLGTGYLVFFNKPSPPTTGSSTTSGSTSTSGSGSTGSSTTGGTGVTHKVPSTGCGPADLTTLQTTFGLSPSSSKPTPEQSVSSSTSKCSVEYEKGSAGANHLLADVELNFEFSNDNSGAVSDFNTDQSVANDLHYTVENITGVGAQAILVTTSSGRMEIYAVDANAVVDAEWFGYGSAASTVSKDSIVTALKTLANTALTRTSS
jgi:hypothetical protein